MIRHRLSLALTLFLSAGATLAAADSGSDPAGDAAPLRLMAFNIRYDNSGDGANAWAKRKDFAAEVIRQFAPDAVGLQEALRHQLDDLGERLPGYAEIGVGRDDGKTKGEYSPILYRADRFEPLESGTFWLSDTPEVIASKSWGNDIPRICTWARLKEKSSGKAFYLFNVHFDHQSQPSRERSAALVVGRMKARAHPGEPAFLTGDFNAGEDNPAIAAIKKAGYADSFREVHPDEKAVGTFNGWGGAGATGGAKIDYIFAPAGTKVADAKIDRVAKDGRTPSDHFPVTAVVEWKR